MAVRRLAEHQPEDFSFRPENQAWAERQIAKYPPGRQASAVIPLLWRAQEQEGWVTKPAIEGVAEMLGMPNIRVLEVATFYTMFHLEPVGAGACPGLRHDALLAARRRARSSTSAAAASISEPHTSPPTARFSWVEVECLGACVNAPMVQIGKDTYEDLTPESFEALLDAFERGKRPRPGPQIGGNSPTPVTGPTTLTDIAYADDDVARPLNGHFGAADAAVAARASDGAARMAVSELPGGEPKAAERLRRKGRTPKKADGADPAGAGDREPGSRPCRSRRRDPTRQPRGPCATRRRVAATRRR